MTQERALKIMKTGVNIYLTGSAGSGKTYLLNKYILYLQNHNIAVAITASTGIAATHMNGMTIHGWSGIGIKDKMGEIELQQLEEKKYLWKRFKKARILIIDEVSMLHDFQLDMIEKVCRRFKRNEKPFGGLQVILSGDFFQLPPVGKCFILQGDDSGKVHKNNMAYTSKAWKILNPAICYLTEQHRQEDQALLGILNTIRDNNVGEKHYKYLKSRINADLGKDKKATKLYTHNINVDNENFAELSQLEGEEKIYEMTSYGKDMLVRILKKSCLAHEKLRLKIGAEIMCVKNNFEQGYVNGSRGKVIDFLSNGTPIVKLYNGKRIEIKSEVWAIEEDGKIKASVTQLPLRLAWAITIHKSQGMSLDNAEIDLRHSFTYGMGYVALSRVRTLSGIRLIGFNAESLKVDPKVFKFDLELRNESIQNELLFKKLKNEQQNKLEIDFIKRMGGSVVVKNKNNNLGKNIDTKVPTILITKELLDQGQSIKQIARERGLMIGTIINHIEQIISVYPETIILHLRPIQKNINLVRKINRKLKGNEIGKLSLIKTMLVKEKNDLSYEEIRLAKLFI